jgi:single-strand DNA-binding protein
MRTAKNSTRNTATKSVQNNQKRKSFSNNLVILTGNLGADAAFFGAHDSAASSRMATKNKFGEKEYVEWHSVIAFRDLAKEVVEKCTKGRFIRVYGRLHASKIENEDGAQFKMEVIATRIKYLDRKSKATGLSSQNRLRPSIFPISATPPQNHLRPPLPTQHC